MRDSLYICKQIIKTKSMKKSMLFMCTCLIAVLISCSSDDDGISEKNIVGRWLPDSYEQYDASTNELIKTGKILREEYDYTEFFKDGTCYHDANYGVYEINDNELTMRITYKSTTRTYHYTLVSVSSSQLRLISNNISVGQIKDDKTYTISIWRKL